jgi:5'-nucleotidase
MALDLSKTLVVGISATALFDMSESDQMFKAALEADPERVIDNYQREDERGKRDRFIYSGF